MNKFYINIMLCFYIFLLAPEVISGSVYYVGNGAIGTNPHNKPNYSACIGSISETLSGLLSQCYSRAPDGYVEDGPEYFRRVWNKRGLNNGSIAAGFIRIPYELRNIRDGSFSTYYDDFVGYRTAECSVEGCYLIALTEGGEQPKICVGNPIDPANGEKLQIETDIAGPINFLRHYSGKDFSSAIGKAWKHSFEKSIVLLSLQSYQHREKFKSDLYSTKQDACVKGWANIKLRPELSWASTATASYEASSNICLIKNGSTTIFLTKPFSTNEFIASMKDVAQLNLANGRYLQFENIAGNEWRPLGNHSGYLLKLSDGSWKYVSNGVIERYSAIGKLTSIEYSGQLSLTFSYDSAQMLQLINSNQNQSVQIKYINNLVSELITGDGKVTKYEYDTSSRLISIIYPNTSMRMYHYEDLRFPYVLTGITDERGKRYATWTYDAQGRAISSEHAGNADKTQLIFNADGSTTVTNPLGKKTVYRFDDIAGARRVVKVEGQPTANCAGANQNYTYTTEGWIESKTDWKGIKTTYQYNTLGQEVSRTEAFGTSEARTITTEWHPTLYLKTKVAEPGKETTFSYDTNGRLLNQSTQALSN